MDTDYLLLGYEVLEKGGGHRRKYGGSTALCYFLFRKMSIGEFKLFVIIIFIRRDSDITIYRALNNANDYKR